MWQLLQNSGVCSVMNGLMNVSRCGCGSSSSSLSWAHCSTGCVLTARSCSGGYSITKSPLPIVLPTCVIAWHDVQPRPFWASGVSICCLIGVSNRPLKNTA